MHLSGSPVDGGSLTNPLARLREALGDRYEVSRSVGSGGMATVYLARDLRHGRPVAIKVLRPDLAAVLGAERFLHEIATTANLQHPHILPLYDSGTVAADPAVPDGPSLLFYVMPYVEGESLRTRLTRETQLPLADAVRITIEVASALDYAHRQGIVHRDIKPENILLQDGRAMVADFGIALAMRRAGGDRLTETGVSLGTPQYMSPEQATAERELDQRTDIYALGTVAYEMISGEPPFTGPTSQSIVAKLMNEAPRPLSTLRATVPPAVEAAVLRALEKLRADRWTTAAEFAAALEERSDVTARLPLRLAASRPLASSRGARIALIATSLAAVALLLWSVTRRERTAPRPIPARVMISLGPDVQLDQDRAPLDISADGSEIVYVGRAAGRTSLYLRPLDSFQARELAGTEGASQPFFSPDGKWVAFFAGGKLLKVPSDGGDPVVLAAAAPSGDGGAWADDGTILFTLPGPVLVRLPPGGGNPVAMPLQTTPASDSAARGRPTFARWPSLLPDGRHALAATDRGIALITLATGELRILRPGNRAQYLPTGHLIYDQGEGRIRLAPFDLRRLEVTGEPVQAFDAFRGPGAGAAQFAVSNTGTLVYMAGGFDRTLVLVDRNGRETPVTLPPRGYRFPAFSPDGRRVAVTIDPRPSNIWVADLALGQLTPVTAAGHNIGALWAPDGARLTFYHGGGVGGVSWTRWQSGAPPAPVLAADPRPGEQIYPSDWPRDGRIVGARFRGGHEDIVTLTMGDTIPRPFAPSPANEGQARVSPDGRWLCFTSNRSGSDEIYVRPYPAQGNIVQVSTGGGRDPHWSRDGREIYYRQGSRIMAVGMKAGSDLAPTGSPQLLFTGTYDFSQDDNWDVGPDGRFIMVRADPQSQGLRVVLNWFTEVEHRGSAPGT